LSDGAYRSIGMLNIFSTAVIQAEADDNAGEGRLAVLPAFVRAQTMSAEQFLGLIERSGLTGKGGAHFPTHRKVSFMQKQESGEKCLIVNGGEHEPGSQKDRYLLETYPQTVIEGALILAHAVNANTILIAVNDGEEKAIMSMKSALVRIADEEYATKTGKPILISVIGVADSYLVGEESALIEALEGREALPRRRPPFPIEQGFHNNPTLVQNVETVGHLPFIVAAGSARYRALSAHDAGVTLCTFGPEFKNPGVRLVPFGISLREVVYAYGGGLKSGQPIKAVQPGGPAAGFLSDPELDVPFEYGALKQAGSALGCAAIRAFSQDDDMVLYVADTMAFFSSSSCGQCPSCRMETHMLNSIMTQVVAKKANEKLLKQVPVIIANATIKPALCGLVQMPARPMLSALEKFPEEFRRYVDVIPQPAVQ
jgi:NADH:ubiquinone oxidoreductase subunit F (NADH-binding)